VSLGSAASFAVLGSASITNTGPSVLNGNAGTSGTSATGFDQAVVGGDIIIAQPADAPLVAARAAYNTIAGFSSTADLTDLDLGGMVLVPGTYSFSSSAQLTGPLTLAGGTDTNATWYFKVGSALTTASGSIVTLTGTAQACNVYWQIGSSATIGSATTFQGAVLAAASITMVTAASSKGGLFALGGSVTLDTNLVNAAVCSVVSSSSSTPAATSTGGVAGSSSTSSSITGTTSSVSVGPVGPSTTLSTSRFVLFQFQAISRFFHHFCIPHLSRAGKLLREVLRILSTREDRKSATSSDSLIQSQPTNYSCRSSYLAGRG
jgi:hypothetical protein